MSDPTTQTPAAATSVASAAPPSEGILSKIGHALGIGGNEAPAPASVQAVKVEQPANIPEVLTASTLIPIFRAKVPDGAPNVDPMTLEVAVEMMAQHLASGESPCSGATLLGKCGQYHIDLVAATGINPDDIARWAATEAHRRSSTLDPHEVRSQSIILG